MAYSPIPALDDLTVREWNKLTDDIETIINLCQRVGLLHVYPTELCPKLHNNWYLGACSKSIDKYFGKYLKSVSRRVLCKISKFQKSPICSKDEAFRENTDMKLTKKWNQILSTIPILTENERNSMRSKVSKEGIHEIYRQTSRFYDDYIQVRDFRKELETKYGNDTRSRKGNEIIFTTEQLIDSRRSCESIMLTRNADHYIQCPMQNRSTINSVFN